MKIKYAVAASLLLSVAAYAQKDELKALKKITDKEQPTPEDITEMGRLIKEAEPKMGAATPEQNIDFYYYKGGYSLMQLLMSPNKTQEAFDGAIGSFNKVIELEKGSKKQKYTKEIEGEILPEVKTAAITAAQQLSEAKQYKLASQYYYAAYKVDPKDPYNLYNAAAMAVNVQDYDSALKYYLELDKIGFTGEYTYFMATNKSTSQDETFPSKTVMDIAINTSKTHTNGREMKQASVRPEIIKQIALIYKVKGEKEKAKEFFANARKENPNDQDLLLAEASLYFELGDTATYKKLIGEAVSKNPNDPTLYYNMAVVSAEAQPAEAEKYYKKALELKPDYFDALVNLSTLQLNGEQKIVDEMNKITGNTAKDNQKYEALKSQRAALYNKALPYLEQAHKIKPDDQYVISVLAGMYQALDRTADYNAMKAKRKS